MAGAGDKDDTNTETPEWFNQRTMKSKYKTTTFRFCLLEKKETLIQNRNAQTVRKPMRRNNCALFHEVLASAVRFLLDSARGCGCF
jgi:hypothetical protein